MAKAVAICRCATCGKEFEKSETKRNRKDADAWEAWAGGYYDECDECRQKRREREREEANREAAELATEAGLVQLKGSEKQVAWAESIRMDFYQRTAAEMERAQEKIARTTGDRKERWRKRLGEMTEFRTWLFSKNDAKFWIDHRGLFTSPEMGMLNAELEFVDLYAKENVPEEVKEELENSIITLEPEDKKHTIVCEVGYTEKAVTVISDYDPDMPPVVKSVGFRWKNSVWQKMVDSTTGSAEDRAVEIANKLLLAGFPVKIDKSISEKVIAGDYTPEYRRWILYDNAKKELTIRVESGADDVVNKARLITGASRYGLVYIPVSSCEEVLEFAQTYDFRISNGAQKAIDAFMAAVIKTAVSPGRETEYRELDTKSILESSRDVLEDLKEEE